jgi:prepilin-type N-terminal cleavage/methylation domain-containing protein
MRSPTANRNTAGTTGAPGAMRGFSLAEVLAALTIGAMISVAVLGIYQRADRSAAAVIQRLDSSRLPSEILQRITEDLDTVISSSSAAKVIIENKLANVAGTMLLSTAKLTITDTIEDNRNRELKFKEIIWQSSYDVESPADGLVLYRSHWEDKVLDKNKEDLEREIFVPICAGVTFFKIEAVTGNIRAERWNSAPPPGIAVTISFAEPYKRVDGTFDVPDEEKITRTIALDRTRKIRFEIAATEEGSGEEAQKGTESPTGGDAPPVEPKTTEKVEKSTK